MGNLIVFNPTNHEHEYHAKVRSKEGLVRTKGGVTFRTTRASGEPDIERTWKQIGKGTFLVPRSDWCKFPFYAGMFHNASLLRAHTPFELVTGNPQLYGTEFTPNSSTAVVSIAQRNTRSGGRSSWVTLTAKNINYDIRCTDESVPLAKLKWFPICERRVVRRNLEDGLIYKPYDKCEFVELSNLQPGTPYIFRLGALPIPLQDPRWGSDKAGEKFHVTVLIHSVADQ